MFIDNLKKSILQKAIQGKLVKQNPNDEPASELLKRIKEEKEKLINDGKMKKEKALTPITDEEKPFEIPSNWKWVRLGNLSKIISKWTTPKWGKDAYKNSGVKFLRAENVKNYEVDETNIQFISEDIHNNFLKRSILEDKDLLICIAGTLGRCWVVSKNNLPLNTNQAVAFVRFINPDLLDIKYIAYTISTPIIQNLLIKQKKITAIPNLTLEIISNCTIPLPPLEEQKRIVAKLDELMPLLDEARPLEEEITKLEEDFPSKLRQSILQYAIKWKLIEQSSEDEPASELLKKIKEEKEKLIKEWKIKNEKPLEPITDEEKLFDIPTSWEWVRLWEITLIERWGSPRPIDAYLTDSEDWLNWIKIGDTKKWYKYIEWTKQRIKPEWLYKTRAIEPWDFLLTNSMSFWEAYISKIHWCIHDWRLRIHPPVELDKDYLYWFLSSPYVQLFFSHSVAWAVVQNLNSERVRQLPLLLPPLEEQKRLVAKLDELMKLCNELENNLN